MPDNVGPYRLFEKLGVGGMGTAYRAENTRTGEIVALKILHPHLAEEPDSIARLQREARIAGRIDHPNVARVLDSGEDAGQFYLAMQFVDGETLAERLRREGRLSEAETHGIATAVAAALDAAHRDGIVHRDIKPGNILVARDGRVLVSDFSVARAIGFTTVTQVGAFVGTPSYAAPESVTGMADIRADLYALGVVMYQALVGQTPFQADSPQAALHQARTKRPDPRPLRAAAPRLAPVVEALLEKDSKRRYQDPAALGAALAGLSGLFPTPIDDATLTQVIARAERPTVAGRMLSTWGGLPRAARIGSAGAVITGLVAAGIVMAGFFFSDGGVVDPPPETPPITVTRTRIPTVTGTVRPPTRTASPVAPTASPREDGADDPSVNLPPPGATSTPPPVATPTQQTAVTSTPTPVVLASPAVSADTPTRTPTGTPTPFHVRTSGTWNAEYSNLNKARLRDVPGGAQVVCLTSGCPSSTFNFNCTDAVTCPGASVPWGCQPPIDWKSPGAPFIWASGISLNDESNDEAFWFSYEFQFAGDILNDYIVDIAYTFDDGVDVFIDGNSLNDVWGNECEVHSLQSEQALFTDTDGTHRIDVWVVSGKCEPSCTYQTNPAGLAMSITIYHR